MKILLLLDLANLHALSINYENAVRLNVASRSLLLPGG